MFSIPMAISIAISIAISMAAAPPARLSTIDRRSKSVCGVHGHSYSKMFLG